MSDVVFDRLVILELANNHMGKVEHGLKVIRAFGEVIRDFSDFRFAFKFQYRDLDTFIHRDYRERMDIKYIRRFSETRLSEAGFLQLKQEAEQLGFHSMCTPFDERSVERIVGQGFEYLKVASCSFNDWPLLERVVRTDKPIVISTAGDRQCGEFSAAPRQGVLSDALRRLLSDSGCGTGTQSDRFFPAPLSRSSRRLLHP